MIAYRGPFEADAFGQGVGRHRQADLVLARFSQVSKPIQKAKGLKDSGIDTDADGIVTGLDPAEGRA